MWMARLVKIPGERPKQEDVQDERQDDAEGAELVDGSYGNAPGVQG